MSAVYPGGVPNLFTSPMAAFPSRNLFHSTERSTGGGISFTQEDRLMLQLLYQQQQAIQIQLQSMALSMQQLHMTLTGLSRSSAPAGAYASSVNDTTQSVNPHSFAQPERQSFSRENTDAMREPHREPVKDSQGHDKTAESQMAHASNVKKSSRSCTPPQDELDASRHSAMNRSMDSAAPWDPSAGSRQSSVACMARGENPLLSSLRGKLPTPNHSVTGSVSVGTGYSASANVSMSLEDSKPFVRPAIYPSSSSSLHVDPDVKNAPFSGRSVPGSHHAPLPPQQQQQQQQEQQQRVVIDNRRAEPSRRSHSGIETAPVVNNRKGEAHHVKEINIVSSQRNRGDKEEYGDVSMSAAGYDSQSDGYGSYETRQYLKSVGII